MTWFKHKKSGQVFAADGKFAAIHRKDPNCEEVDAPSPVVPDDVPDDQNPEHPVAGDSSPPSGVSGGEGTPAPVTKQGTAKTGQAKAK